MTPRSSAIPTAVITESRENTMSSSMIWIRTLVSEGLTRTDSSPSSPSSLSWISWVLLYKRNRPPMINTRSRPEISSPSTVNNGSVSLMIHVRENSRPIRMIIARPRPAVRAVPCFSRGSLPARMEMKMTLSMPRTISSTVRVSRAIHASGLVIQSISRHRRR